MQLILALLALFQFGCDDRSNRESTSAYSEAITKYTGFADEQLRFTRVREAKALADPAWRTIFKEKGVAFPPSQLYLRAFKHEKELEIWAKDSSVWVLIKTFDICKVSGVPGPKRKEGDRQVPEGFYHISAFNPNSDYYLSLKINYPNASDEVLSDKLKPGGDIFIHGKCVTIGCLPMTDGGIKMIYWLCVLSRSEGQDRIPVSIFPCRLTWSNLDALSAIYFNNPALAAFWRNLKEGYDYFETRKQLPSVSVDADGRYEFR